MFTSLRVETRGILRIRLGGHTFWTDDQTSPFLGSAVNRFNDINQFLLILQHPIQLVVVSRPKIAHLYEDQQAVDVQKQGAYHVLVAEEEHECHGIIELVHLLEVWNLV